MTHEAETDEIFEFSERLRIQTFEFGFRTPMLHFLATVYPTVTLRSQIKLNITHSLDGRANNFILSYLVKLQKI